MERRNYFLGLVARAICFGLCLGGAVSNFASTVTAQPITRPPIYYNQGSGDVYYYDKDGVQQNFNFGVGPVTCSGLPAFLGDVTSTGGTCVLTAHWPGSVVTVEQFKGTPTCDGTDDGPAFRAAISSLGAPGGVVQLQSCIYTVSSVGSTELADGMAVGLPIVGPGPVRISGASMSGSTGNGTVIKCTGAPFPGMGCISGGMGPDAATKPSAFVLENLDVQLDNPDCTGTYNQYPWATIINGAQYVFMTRVRSVATNYDPATCAPNGLWFRNGGPFNSLDTRYTNYQGIAYDQGYGNPEVLTAFIKTVSTITNDGTGKALFTVTASHAFTVGERVRGVNASDGAGLIADYQGDFIVATTPTSVTYTLNHLNGTPVNYVAGYIASTGRATKALQFIDSRMSTAAGSQHDRMAFAGSGSTIRAVAGMQLNTGGTSAACNSCSALFTQFGYKMNDNVSRNVGLPPTYTKNNLTYGEPNFLYLNGKGSETAEYKNVYLEYGNWVGMVNQYHGQSTSVGVDNSQTNLTIASTFTGTGRFVGNTFNSARATCVEIGGKSITFVGNGVTACGISSANVYYGIDVLASAVNATIVGNSVSAGPSHADPYQVKYGICSRSTDHIAITGNTARGITGEIRYTSGASVGVAGNGATASVGGC